MDAAKGTFDCHVAATFFLDQSMAAQRTGLFGFRLGDVEEYENHRRPMDRMSLAVKNRAIPVHNWQLLTENEARRDPVWLGYARWHHVEHYLAAPIFGSRGRLDRVARPVPAATGSGPRSKMPSALSGFLSATLARVAAPSR